HIHHVAFEGERLEFVQKFFHTVFLSLARRAGSDTKNPGGGRRERKLGQDSVFSSLATAWAAPSRKEPAYISIMPASASLESSGSMGILASTGSSYLAAISSTWLSPNTAMCLPQSGQTA